MLPGHLLCASTVLSDTDTAADTDNGSEGIFKSRIFTYYHNLNHQSLPCVPQETEEENVSTLNTEVRPSLSGIC